MFITVCLLPDAPSYALFDVPYCILVSLSKEGMGSAYTIVASILIVMLEVIDEVFSRVYENMRVFPCL